MRLGIWKGSHPERVHAAYGGGPRCGVTASNGHYWTGREPSTWITWPGTLHEVDCKRCLVSERARLRKKLELVEHRLAGRKGVQRDAFEESKA